MSNLTSQEIIAFAVIVVVLLVAVVWILLRARKRRQADIQNDTDATLEAFGEPVYIPELRINDVRDWAQEHKSTLRNGGKALASKVTNEIFDLMVRGLASDGINVDFNASNYFNNLILAVLNAKGEIAEFVLVKYDRISPQLEQLLARGNGQFVIEG